MQFANIGVSEHYPQTLTRVVRLTNKIIGVGFVFCLFSIIPILAFGHRSILYLALLLFCLLSAALWLSKRKKHKMARSGVFFIAMLIPGISVVTSDIHSYTFFDFTLVYMIILFLYPERKEGLRALVITLACFTVTVAISYYNLIPKMSLGNNLMMGIVNAAALICMVHYLFKNLMVENMRVEEQMTEVMNDLSLTNEKLEKEKGRAEEYNKRLLAGTKELEHEIAVRAKTEQALKDSNEALQQFAYVASHDLKEPLRTIGSFANLLVRRISGKLEKRDLEFVEYITSGVDRMTMLLDDLLKYARLNNPVTYELVDLNNTLEVVKYNLKDLRDRQHAKVEFEHMPTLHANKSQLLQVFQNLASNGIKFNNSKTPTIKVSCKEEESEYVFTVRDNGIGISKAHQERIFQIFQRLHNREDYEGSGIGLSVVQKIISNHNGKISVESEEGAGTAFIFSIAKNLGQAPSEGAQLKDTVAAEVVQN